LNAIIFGAPGAGKGTYSTRLKDVLGVEVISMGDVFRAMLKGDSELSAKIKSYVQNGRLVPDAIVVEVLQDALSKAPKSKGVILDGYPRTLPQAEALENVLPIDVIIQLVVPDWIIIERLSSRQICQGCGNVYNLRYLKPKQEGKCDKCGGKLYQRADDQPEVIKTRLTLYEQETSPILEYYKTKGVPVVVQTTDSVDMPPEKAVTHIVSELKKAQLA
jgi:adenylate kinase